MARYFRLVTLPTFSGWALPSISLIISNNMVKAYHVIFCAYGFWLPNDQRGSWSQWVRSWDLFRYGEATKVTTRRSVAGARHTLWLFFFAFYTYFVMNALEGEWGSGPLTVFTFSSYLSAIGGSLLTMHPVNVWSHVIENVSLAFGTVFPNFELMLFLVLPVKAKYLAFLAGGLILFQFIVGGIATKILLLICVSPYLIFFGPMLYGIVQDKRKHKKHKERFNDDMWR